MIRDYVYIADVAEAFACAVDYEGPMSVFNISSGSGTSLNELIDKIERVVNHKIARDYQPARLIDVPISVLDNTLARQELKWIPQMSFDDGLIKTASWIKKETSR